MSSIQKWHVGKLVILWSVCAAWFLVLSQGLPQEIFSWVIVLGGIAYIPVCLVVTWIWLSGREGKR